MGLTRSLRYLPGNRLSLLHNGGEFFPALLAAIDGAQKEIYLETYRFADDASARRVQAALITAAQRGVKVRVMLDWVGTGRTQATALVAQFKAMGVHCRIFNPWFGRGVARTHRKLVVVDQILAFVGGINITDDLQADHPSLPPLAFPRWDMAVQLEGPLVARVLREVMAQWLRLGSLRLWARWELFSMLQRASEKSTESPMLASFVVRDNLRHRRAIQRAYLKALGMARHSVLLANPYFAPGRKLRKALAHAAERGVAVTLLLGVGEYRVQDWVTRSFYPYLLEHGVQIVEYHKTQLHAKVAVVDEVWATVGSCNVDGLSLFVNHEANIVVRDADFCAALRAKIVAAVADGVPVDAAQYRSMPLLQRLLYGGAYLVYRNIMQIISLGAFTE